MVLSGAVSGLRSTVDTVSGGVSRVGSTVDQTLRASFASPGVGGTANVKDSRVTEYMQIQLGLMLVPFGAAKQYIEDKTTPSDVERVQNRVVPVSLPERTAAGFHPVALLFAAAAAVVILWR